MTLKQARKAGADWCRAELRLIRTTTSRKKGRAVGERSSDFEGAFAYVCVCVSVSEGLCMCVHSGMWACVCGCLTDLVSGEEVRQNVKDGASRAGMVKQSFLLPILPVLQLCCRFPPARKCFFGVEAGWRSACRRPPGTGGRTEKKSSSFLPQSPSPLYISSIPASAAPF